MTARINFHLITAKYQAGHFWLLKLPKNSPVFTGPARPPNKCSGYDTKQSNGEVPVMLDLGEYGVHLHCQRSQVHSDPEW